MIQQFLQAGLIHSLTITRIPVLIGSGIPLFGPLSKDVQLRHIQTRHTNPTGWCKASTRSSRAAATSRFRRAQSDIVFPLPPFP